MYDMFVNQKFSLTANRSGFSAGVIGFWNTAGESVADLGSFLSAAAGVAGVVGLAGVATRGADAAAEVAGAAGPRPFFNRAMSSSILLLADATSLEIMSLNSFVSLPLNMRRNI